LPFNTEVTGTCPSILKLQELALQYWSYRNLPFNMHITQLVLLTQHHSEALSRIIDLSSGFCNYNLRK
jgi:hypothetical protein